MTHARVPVDPAPTGHGEPTAGREADVPVMAVGLIFEPVQANAVIAARTRIVSGAVGMVEMALAELQKNGVVQLDEERKAQMVSNLLVVLCGDRGTQPVVNAGSIY